jgi:hypothetical protein
VSGRFRGKNHRIDEEFEWKHRQGSGVVFPTDSLRQVRIVLRREANPVGRGLIVDQQLI